VEKGFAKWQPIVETQQKSGSASEGVFNVLMLLV